MYGVVRLIIGCLFFGCSAIVMKKNKAVNKFKLRVILAGLSVILVFVLGFLPFENLFITFQSPEAAYEYSNFGKSNVDLVVEGNNCDFVIEQENESYTYLIIPKTSDGWKTEIGLNTKMISQKFFDGITVQVYQYKNTNDYFITVLDTNGGEAKISDEYNTEFYRLERFDDVLQKNFVTYFAHISDLTIEYSLTVNGSKIELT